MSTQQWDFGFTAVDESELEAIQQATATADQYQKRVDDLYNAIIPLLNNLMKDPHKAHIYWPDRETKIKEFIAHLKEIKNGNITVQG